MSRAAPASAQAEGPRVHGWPTLAVVALLAAAAFAGFGSLGVWQLQRRTWKLELIARVQARIHAAPAPAPGPADWPRITAAAYAYRRVRATGVLLNGDETRVQALTELGAGFWVLTPLRTRAGFTVLVNRGFAPSDQADPAARARGQPAGPVTVTGLLRVSEPGGSVVQRNAPKDDRWYSRDVAAVARARRLGVVAPYFIDADDTPNPGGSPVGGLTVVSFPNSHLVYAVTWFSLALMVAGAAGFTAREELRARRAAASRPRIPLS